VTDSLMVDALMDKANAKLKAAKILLDAAQYDDVVLRCYYAVFNAMSALLYKKGLVYSSHGQVIGAFNREFIKTGIFSPHVTRQIQALFEDRQSGDYDPIPSISSEIAENHLKNAESILTSITTLIIG